MSDAIKGFGDRVRVSVSGVSGDGNDGKAGDGKAAGDSQNYVGVSGRASFDLVDGDLILAPRFGFDYARVKAERRQEFTIGLDGEPQGWGAPEGDTFYYTAVTERAEASRVTPRVGIGIGWLPQIREGAIGAQAVFDVGSDKYLDYQIERFPNERVRADSKDAKGLSLRAGAEFLTEAYFWEDKKNPGIGIVMGLYWVRSLNPISDKGEGGLEASVGLLVSF